MTSHGKVTDKSWTSHGQIVDKTGMNHTSDGDPKLGVLIPNSLLAPLQRLVYV